MTVAELAEAVLSGPGIVEESRCRTLQARAVVRAAVEVERTMADPRLSRPPGRRLGPDRPGRRAGRLRPAKLGRRGGQAGRRRSAGRPGPGPGAAAADRRAVAGHDSRHPPAPAGGRGLESCRRVQPARTLSPGHAGRPHAPALSGGLARAADAHRRPDPGAGREPLSRGRSRCPIRPSWTSCSGMRVRLPLGPDRQGRHGCYVSPHRDMISVTSDSESSPRLPTMRGPDRARRDHARGGRRPAVRGTPPAGAQGGLIPEPAGQPEAPRSRLRARSAAGSRSSSWTSKGCSWRPCRPSPARPRVNWDLVLKTDARPQAGDWDKLMMLVGRTMPVAGGAAAPGRQTMLDDLPRPAGPLRPDGTPQPAVAEGRPARRNSRACGCWCRAITRS